MKISDVKNHLSSLVNEVYRNETRILVEKAGIPVAAIVSARDLRRLSQFEQERGERFKVIDELRAAFKDVDPDVIEREADRAVAELRGKTAIRNASDEFAAVIARAREAFKDVPPEEIEREVDRIIASNRAAARAAAKKLAATG